MLLVFSPVILGAAIAAAAGEVVRKFPARFRDSWEWLGR